MFDLSSGKKPKSCFFTRYLKLFAVVPNETDQDQESFAFRVP